MATIITREGSSEAELISAVRTGDTEAYGELFERHGEAALRMARQLVHGSDADDLVAESFYRVLTVLQDGKGPDESFRAYLLTAIRRLHIDRVRAGSRVRATDDEADLDRAVAFVDPAEMRFEQGAAAAAFATLPERWQLVLWHLDVEGQKPAQVAPLLGMSANSVSALAYRAREGLRQAYLQGHLAPTLHAGCRRTTGLLGAYVRAGLSARDTAAVDAHLDGCSRCMGLLLELREVNANLAGAIGPALLGTAFGGYAASGTTAGLAGGAAGTAVGVKLVAAAVVTTVAAAGAVAVTTDFGGRSPDGSQVVARATPRPVPTTDRGTGRPRSTRPIPEESRAAPRAGRAQPTREPTVPPVPPVPVPTAPAPSDVAPRPEAVVPTDYGVGTVDVADDDTVGQRRLTIPVTASNPGRAVAEQVTMAVSFGHMVRFRGVVSPGWDCGAAVRNQWLRTLTCTTTLPAGQGAVFVAKAQGPAGRSGSVAVRAADDPEPGNDATTFHAGPWLPSR